MLARSGAMITFLSKRLILILLMLVALLSLAGRVVLGQVDYFKAEIEQQLAGYGITGVSLDSVKGSWQGFHPLLRINGASLSIPGRSQALTINQLDLSVNMLSSLFHGELKLRSLHSNIEKLILVRDKSSQWWMNDIPLMGQPDNDEKLDVYAFFDRLPDFVSIDIRLLQIRDLNQSADYLMQKVGLHSSSDGDVLSLILDGQLPETLGNKLSLKLTGDASKQQLYLQADKLALSRISRLMNLKTPGVQEARVSLQSWIDLDHYQPRQIVNEAQFSDVQISQVDSEVDSEPQDDTTETNDVRFELRQKAVNQNGEWQIDSEFSHLYKGQQSLPGFNTRLVLDKARKFPQLWVDKIDVKTLQSLFLDILRDQPAFKLINKIALNARVKNFITELNLDEIDQSSFSFEFENLHNKHSDSLPAINGLDGQIQVSAGKGEIRLASSRLALDFGDLFRLPIKLNELTADIRIAQINNQWLLQSDEIRFSNADLKAQGRVWLEIPHEGIPFMSLRAQYQDGNASATSRYLPVSIMPETTVAWLDSSIKGGKLTQGDLMFHGRLENLSSLQNKQSGEFRAKFLAENPKIDIFGGWPSVNGGQGEVSFHNTQMDISFSQVQFASSEVDQVRVQIPDLMNADLLINAKTQVGADDLLETLSALPVLNVFDEVKAMPHSANGLVECALDISIPLAESSKSTSVKAKAKLRNVKLSIPDWMVDYDQLNGELRIDNEYLTADKISGRYASEPVELQIQSDKKNQTINFDMQGALKTASLMKLLPDYIRKPVKGKSAWQVKVSIPNDNQPLAKGIKVTANSELAGTELNFPQPMSLKSNEKLPVRAEITIREHELDYLLQMDNLVSNRGKFKLDKRNDYQMQAMNVVFGETSKPDLPQQGIELSGAIETLNLNDWSKYSDSYFKQIDFQSLPVLQQVSKVNLAIKNLQLGSQQVTDTKLKLANDNTALRGRVDSSLAKGYLEIPYQINAEKPFSAELEYLHWEKSASEEKLNHKIEDMPNLNVSSKLAVFGAMEFDNFILKTRNQSNTFVIQQLDIAKDKVQLKSSGHWQYNPQDGSHVSVFNINIRGDDFGAAIDHLGLGETIKNGKIKFNGQIGWGGSLFDINWPTLIGEVQLELKDGYLRNVDPGAGRFVGLLSLNALPKRLFLDFGDVLNQGMQFNEINGKFSIKGEIMHTENAFMDSDAAKVKIIGDTNLHNKTYDQTMFIIPKIGETLPVIGSLTAGNAVGWGLLLLQKIFKKPIEKSVEIEYKVSGSWDKPDITLVQKPQQDSKPENSFDLENNK